MLLSKSIVKFTKWKSKSEAIYFHFLNTELSFVHFLSSYKCLAKRQPFKAFQDLIHRRSCRALCSCQQQHQFEKDRKFYIEKMSQSTFEFVCDKGSHQYQVSESFTRYQSEVPYYATSALKIVQLQMIEVGSSLEQIKFLLTKRWADDWKITVCWKLP